MKTRLILLFIYFNTLLYANTSKYIPILMGDITILIPNNSIKLSSGLVAYYKFENNTYDSSGNKKHGVGYGKIHYTAGVDGNAAYFDGKNDYIIIKSISEKITKNAWSYSIWVNRNDIKRYGLIFNGRNLSPNTNDYMNRKNGLLWFHHNGKLSLVSKGSFDYDQLDKEGPYLKKNKWYHIVYIYEGNNKHVVYINGILASSLTTKTSGSVELTDNIGFQIARHYYRDDENSFFNGKLDNLRIYNRALNMNEINTLYKLKL